MTQVQLSPSLSAAPARRPRGKVAVGLLACLFGWLGAHWWYLGRRYAWAVTLLAAVSLFCAFRYYPVWYDNPAFFLLFIPMIDGFIESAVFSLMSDEKFDRRYNAAHGRPTSTGWGPVLVALLACLVGSVVSMFAIAMVVVYVWVAMGWLDGLKL
ncbi:TM2 domain-containing protein [Achromobacter spanius]|uniref:Membrane protein n=1 Tax=Achromobacter spanius TaxID=217203 RepID=A0AAW3I3Y6_9BURK|nr:TM2 domain-containing protein [Achromobacter spanius]KNE27354.1 membrane protein [Achromobacter spanius]MCW3152307.1 TM2 domain-containing protein [Achromobacter spanius]